MAKAPLSLAAALLAAALAPLPAPAADGAATQVDAALVLLVDVSFSIDEGEYALQKQGYTDAFRSKALQSAVRSGQHGRVAVTYVEWDGTPAQRVPWTVIAGREDAERFAAAIAAAPRHHGNGHTGVSSALLYARQLFAGSGVEGRRIIDLSGDGTENTGGDPAQARDLAVADGITVNGIAITTDDKVRQFFKDEVVGGNRSFLLFANDFSSFGEAILQKLALEISGAEVAPQLAQGAPEATPRTRSGPSR